MGVQAYSSGLGVIRVCWIIFVVFWLLGAFSTKRTIYRESSSERARYWLVLVIGYFLVIKSSNLPSPFDWFVVPHTKLSAWIGAFLCVSGLIFALWARVILGRNWSGVVTFKGGHELITRGPYALVRHPIYTGLLTMFVATVIVLGHVAGIIAMPLVFVSIWIKLRYEEKLMLQKFPGQYAAYQRRVKRLIPFIF